MSEPSLRPYYSKIVTASSEEVQSILKKYSWPTGLRFEIQGDHGQCTITGSTKRWFSPWLEFELRPKESVTLIEGRFSANPSFFTLWMALLALSVIGSFGFLGFGYSQWILGETMWAFGASAICAPIAVGLAFLPLYGQAKGRDQMQALKAEMDTALECFT